MVWGTGGALTLCPAVFTPQGASRLLQGAAIDPVTFPLCHRATLAWMDPGTSGAAPGVLLMRSNPPPSVLWQLFPSWSLEEGGKLPRCIPPPPYARDPSLAVPLEWAVEPKLGSQTGRRGHSGCGAARSMGRPFLRSLGTSKTQTHPWSQQRAEPGAGWGAPGCCVGSPEPKSRGTAEAVVTSRAAWGEAAAPRTHSRFALG